MTLLKENIGTLLKLLVLWLSTYVPGVFWGEAILTTVDLINTILSSDISVFLILKSCIGMSLFFL
jgi:hypothetical protein